MWYWHAALFPHNSSNYLVVLPSLFLPLQMQVVMSRCPNITHATHYRCAIIRVSFFEQPWLLFPLFPIMSTIQSSKGKAPGNTDTNRDLVILVDIQLNFSNQCQGAAAKANKNGMHHKRHRWQKHCFASIDINSQKAYGTLSIVRAWSANKLIRL